MKPGKEIQGTVDRLADMKLDEECKVTEVE